VRLQFKHCIVLRSGLFWEAGEYAGSRRYGREREGVYSGGGLTFRAEDAEARRFELPRAHNDASAGSDATLECRAMTSRKR
jgi:hypothetical protein